MFYKIAVIISKILIFPFFRIKVHGSENIKKDDGLIVCANHRSNFDPFFLAISLPVKFNFMGKKELFDYPILGKLLKLANVFPIDRKSNDLKALRYSINLLKKGETIGIFPEGTRVKDIDRSNMKEGVGFIALRSKKNIVPIEILTSYKIFSRVDIFVNKPIEVGKYKNEKNKIAMEKISDQVFKEIYKRRREIS